jgi:hypothetical protein
MGTAGGRQSEGSDEVWGERSVDTASSLPEMRWGECWRETGMEVGEEESKVRSGPVKVKPWDGPKLHQVTVRHGVAQDRRL